jgi:uncharacterized protein (DUF302 family)
MKNLILLLLLACVSDQANANAYLITKESKNDVKTTVERFVKVATSKGLTIFKKVDHQAGATSVGQALSPNTVVIFGNPKIGTVLMKENPAVGIDLPLKVHVYENANGKVLISYYSPKYFMDNYGVSESPAIKKMTGALDALTNFASGNN